MNKVTCGNVAIKTHPNQTLYQLFALNFTPIPTGQREAGLKSKGQYS